MILRLSVLIVGEIEGFATLVGVVITGDVVGATVLLEIVPELAGGLAITTYAGQVAWPINRSDELVPS